MRFELETIGCGLLLPAALSVVVTWAFLRALPRDVALRFAGAVGCAVGFFVGYALLEPRHLRPATYWQWLPWLGIVAAVAAPIGLVSRVPSVCRWTLWLVISVVSAWLLVPTWVDLKPSRDVYVALVTACVFLLTAQLDMLGRRTSGTMFSLSLCVSASCGAVLLAAFVSVRFGLLTVAAAAALSGCWVISFRDSSRELVRGVTLFYSVVVGGLLLTGQVAAVLPSVCFALILAAPLMLWLCEFPPLSRPQGKWGVLIRLVAISLPLATACLLAV